MEKFITVSVKLVTLKKVLTHLPFIFWHHELSSMDEHFNVHMKWYKYSLEMTFKSTVSRTYVGE